MALPRVTCRESVVSLHRDDPAARPKSSLASAWSKSGRCAGHLAAARLLLQVRTRVLNDQPLATSAAGIPASTRRQIQRRSRR